MKLSLNARHSYELIIEAENVKIVEDIESREYQKDENGKTIYTTFPKRDIQTDALDQIANLLDDMIYHRKDAYDSTSLIERLFEKMPEHLITPLVEKLKSSYAEDET